MKNKARILAVLLLMILGALTSARAGEPASPGQSAEQKVLDRLLGTWSQEETTFKAKWTPEEKHATGVYTFTRILDGKYVQQSGQNSEKNCWLVLYTYDEQKRCYLSWAFSSISGGPQSPSTGKWNEAAGTIEWFSIGNEGQASTLQMRFINDDTVVSNFVMKDAGGEVLLHVEFKMTRLKGAHQE